MLVVSGEEAGLTGVHITLITVFGCAIVIVIVIAAVYMHSKKKQQLQCKSLKHTNIDGFSMFFNNSYYLTNFRFKSSIGE